jgi:hypothetical protein
VTQDVEFHVLLYPVCVVVLRSLVERERNGSDEGNASHGGGHAWRSLGSEHTSRKCTSDEERTPKETTELLIAVCVLHAIEKASVVICLHTRLNAVEWKCGQGREDARGTGRDLGAVSLDEDMVGLTRFAVASAAAAATGAAHGGGVAGRNRPCLLGAIRGAAIDGAREGRHKGGGAGR